MFMVQMLCGIQASKDLKLSNIGARDFKEGVGVSSLREQRG